MEEREDKPEQQEKYIRRLLRLPQARVFLILVELVGHQMVLLAEKQYLVRKALKVAEFSRLDMRILLQALFMLCQEKPEIMEETVGLMDQMVKA